MSGLTVIRVRLRYCFLFALFALFACLLNFTRVAFVFSRLILIKAWQNKRAGGLENGLFDTFMDSICVWLENGLFYVFLHWCRWAWNCQIAWDGLGAAFHTLSKTFRYARGLFMSQLIKQLIKQLGKQWCITYDINNASKTMMYYLWY